MKWKFIAEFLDGSFIRQTDEDISTRVEGKNAFYDVLNPLSPLIRFTLEQDGVEYGIDLRTLNFNTGGNEFRLHSERQLFEWSGLTEQKVHFFRYSNAKQNIHFKIGNKGELIETGTENLPVEFSHIELGWSAKNKKGETITRMIEID